MSTKPILSFGDSAPWFTCASTANQQFHFQTVAGRYIVLCFFGSTSIKKNADVVEYLTRDLRHVFNDDHVSFFGISIDPQDLQQQRIKSSMPGIRYFWDFDYQVSRLYGALQGAESSSSQSQINYHPFTLILDPSLRVLHRLSMANTDQHNQQISAILSQLPAVDDHAGVTLHAPILIVPRVFEPKFCQQLIELYKTYGGGESGFMRDQGGKTVGMLDPSFKRRQDFFFANHPELATMRREIQARIVQRLLPEITKAYNFNVTRIERYVVACYEGVKGGFFRPHRDNTTHDTAHRRFACTINLNAEDYCGGDLRFPEFGRRLYRAPTGGAVVFSCSLLHEATPVTKVVRYAFLPFFYDEEAAKTRLENKISALET